jgi:hypothetical protein
LNSAAIKPLIQKQGSEIYKRNGDVLSLVEKLQEVLNFLDENDLSIAAIKVEEAIDALEDIALENQKPTTSD